MLVPLVDHALLDSPSSGNLGSLGRAGRLLAAAGDKIRNILALPLAALGVLVSVGASVVGHRRSTGGADSAAVVVVNASHVVLEVPVPGESITGDGTVATLVSAQVGLVAMAVHGVSLTLMAQQAGCGGEAGVLARSNLAAVGLEVRVDKLAVTR